MGKVLGVLHVGSIPGVQASPWVSSKLVMHRLIGNQFIGNILKILVIGIIKYGST